MVIIAFIVGYLVCFAHFYLVSERRYSVLQADFRHLINEFSIRTGGRKVFREEKRVEQNGVSNVETNADRFSILLPSMAEEEAEERDERESISDLSDADMEHLRSRGVIR